MYLIDGIDQILICLVYLEIDSKNSSFIEKKPLFEALNVSKYLRRAKILLNASDLTLTMLINLYDMLP